uniref:Uncharacterized protein n=1 Tax=viral metagenome TaxID=1070528 RepID=A0A6C0HPS4_9ZZZZ
MDENILHSVKDAMLLQYTEQLTEIELIVLEIAKDQLESSFCLEKSIGFIEWLKHNNLK